MGAVGEAEDLTPTPNLNPGRRKAEESKFLLFNLPLYTNSEPDLQSAAAQHKPTLLPCRTSSRPEDNAVDSLSLLDRCHL